MQESSRIGINLISLVVSRFLCLALSLVQMGIIFRSLGVEGSGQFGYALQYTSLFTVFATLGIQRLLVRDIARDPAVAWTHAWTAVAVMVFLSAVVVSVIGISISLIEPNVVVRGAVMMASISVIVFWALQSPFEALLMAHERMVLLAVANLVSGVARLVFTYFALLVAPTSMMAFTGIALGNAVAFVTCVGCAIAVVGWERPRFRLKLALAQVYESAPFTVAMFLSLIYFKSDMSLLKWFRGDSAAGVYTAVQRFMEPLLMIASIWGTAVFPALCRFSVAAPDSYARLMKTSARLALMFAFPMAFGIAVLATPIVGILTGARAVEFVGSAAVLRILCVMVPFFYLNGVAQEFLYSSHRNWYVVSAYALASCVSLIGNLAFIPHFGVYAVAWVAGASNAAVSILFVYGMRREYGTMHLPTMTLKTLIACSVMALAAHMLNGLSIVAAVVGGGIVYFMVQALLRTLTREEQALLVSMFQAGIQRVSRKPSRV